MPPQSPVKLVQLVRPLKPGGWQRAAVELIDDLRNAVLDAGLEATQLSRTPIPAVCCSRRATKLS